jgi:hypothetical protein
LRHGYVIWDSMVDVTFTNCCASSKRSKTKATDGIIFLFEPKCSRTRPEAFARVGHPVRSALHSGQKFWRKVVHRVYLGATAQLLLRRDRLHEAVKMCQY